MIDLKIQIDGDKLKLVEDMLAHIPKGAERAVSRSMNRTIIGVRTIVTKSVTELYEIKSGDVRETIRIEKASPSKLSARLISSGPVIGLQRFKHSPKSARSRPKIGVRVRVRKDSPMEPYKGAFLTPSIQGIYRRTTRDRLPIERIYGPAVPSMVKTVTDEQQIQDQAGDRFIKELNHEVDFLLTKGKR